MRILNDFDTNIRRAFSEIDPNWESYEGLVVCGTHSPHDVDEYIEEIRKARENMVPFLGVCFGYQLAGIEYVRNVLQREDATSEEFGKGTFFVTKRENPKIGYHEGESWWSYYDIADDYPFLKRETLSRNMLAVPYHPEYQSRIGKPHPLLVKFLNLCKTGNVGSPLL